MPAYDFKCTKCECVFEVVRSAGSADPVTCADCGKPAKRVFSPVGVVFKGSGFHNTDYRAKPKDDTPAAQPCDPAGSKPTCSGCPAASAD